MNEYWNDKKVDMYNSVCKKKTVACSCDKQVVSCRQAKLTYRPCVQQAGSDKTGFSSCLLHHVRAAWVLKAVEIGRLCQLNIN